MRNEWPVGVGKLGKAGETFLPRPIFKRAGRFSPSGVPLLGSHPTASDNAIRCPQSVSPCLSLRGPENDFLSSTSTT